MDPYDYIITYLVLPRVREDLGPRLTELQTAMSVADDKINALAADVANLTTIAGTVTQTMTDLRAQLTEVGVSAAALTALDAADQTLRESIAKLQTAVAPPTTTSPANPPA